VGSNYLAYHVHTGHFIDPGIEYFDKADFEHLISAHRKNTPLLDRLYSPGPNKYVPFQPQTATPPKTCTIWTQPQTKIQYAVEYETAKFDSQAAKHV